MCAMEIPQGLLGLLYARKSSYRGKTSNVGRSVEEQLAEERTWCSNNGVTIQDTYIDDDRSASRFATKEREEFERLIADIEARKGTIVVAWESSRLQRDLDVYVRLRKACWTNGVLWCYGGRVYDMADRDDRRMTAYDAIRDEDDSEQISERVRRAMRANAAAGRPHGPPLYGYRRVYDDRGRLVVVEINEDQAAVVREIAEAVASGEALIAIARKLTEQGVPSASGSSRWPNSTLRKMLLNPAYIGKRRHNGDEIGDAIWPPILAEDVFQTCRAVLSDEARRTTRDGAIKHLLSGIASCGVCGGPARTIKHKAGPGRAYWCHGTGHFNVRKDRIDDYIEAVLVKRLAADDAAEFFAVEHGGDLATERANIKRWENELAKGEELVDAGEMTMKRLANMEQRLLPKIEAARAKLRQATGNPALTSLIRPTVEEVWTEWRDRDIAQQRAALRGAFAWIRISPPGRGRVPPPEEYIAYRWRSPGQQPDPQQDGLES